MNILGLTRSTQVEKMDAVQYYRTFLPLREVNRQAKGLKARIVGSDQLEESMFMMTYGYDSDANPDEAFEGYDICSMARMYHEDCEPFIQKLHDQGTQLVFDCDDDLTETYKLVSGRSREFKKVLGLVDWVTVSTQPLADLFSPFTKEPPTILKNCVDGAWMQDLAVKSNRMVNGFVIGFTGSPTHWGDWRLPSVPLFRIANDYENVMILFQGQVPFYLTVAFKPLGKMVTINRVPFAIYPTVLNQFDAVLCAVDINDRYNDGKSAVKALECLALGITPICSRFKPYMDMEEAGAPVVIVEEESQDGWYEAIRKVIDGRNDRGYWQALGKEWVRTNRDMTVSGYKEWEAFYHAIENA